MGIGASIFLIAAGAILAFAVDATVSGLDIEVVGFILMAAGVLGLAYTLYLTSRSRTGTGVVREERVVRDPNRDVY